MTDATREHDIAMYAASFMFGMRDVGDGDVKTSERILSYWSQGCVELISQLVEHVAFLMDVLNAIQRKFGDAMEWPGVFDYEVCEPYGKWFGQYIIDNGGEAPNDEMCRTELGNSIVLFFNQNENFRETMHIALIVDTQKEMARNKK